MTTVAVTGVSGYIGSKTVQALSSRDDVTRIVGIDVVPPAGGAKLEFYEMDVRSPDLAGVVDGCDVVVHLAGVATADADEVRDHNVGGTRSVIDACTKSRIGRLVYASSYRVYGPHADNAFPLDEGAPMRPGATDAYAQSKVESERILSFLASSHPELSVTALRLAWTCGPTIPARCAELVDAQVRVVVEGYDPPVQALHEDDAGEAVAFAATNDLSGTFNVCADDWVSAPETILSQRQVALDPHRAQRAIRRLARLGIAPAPPSVGALMYPQVMSNEALRTAGFAPVHTTAAALEAAAKARERWMAIGGIRFRPRRVALVGASLGAVLVGSAVRSRRRATRGS